MKEATLVIMDEINVMFLNIAEGDLHYISNIFAHKAPNARFDPRVKLGRWDGNIRFFAKNGKTFYFLLDEIIPIVINLGYSIKLIDKRLAAPALPKCIDENYHDEDTGIILRPYQVDAVNSIISHGNGLVLAATGSGKTITIATLAKVYGHFGYRSLIIVPTIELVEQTIQEGFDACNMHATAYFGLSKDLDSQYVVATWQSVAKVPNMVQQFQCLIIDEAHQAKATMIKSLAQEYGKNIPVRVGFTGTLPKDLVDRLTIKSSLGPQRYEIRAKELQDRGYLATLQITSMVLKEDLKSEYTTFCEEHAIKISYRDFKKQYLPDYQSEKKFLYKKESRQKFITNFAYEMSQQTKGNTLLLVDRREYARELAEAIPGAYYVRSEDDVSERQEIYKKFQDQDNVMMISTVKLIGTGLNIKRIFNVIALDCTKSYVTIIQLIGRGLRLADDKEHVNLYDISSDLQYSNRHRKARLNYYNEEQYPYTETEIDYADYE